MTNQTAEPGWRRDHGCQTIGCPNDFAVITIRVDDGETAMLCESCNLAFNVAIVQQLAEQGMLPGFEPAGPAAGGPAPAPVV